MKDTKRQILPGGLWVIATPIGNLADITPRALEALSKAEIIFCEDTRRTSTLLSALGFSEFSRKLERLDAYTPITRIRSWIENLKSGCNFAFVTDAGTPAISDPGADLVSEARLAGIRITPFPGASAVLTLLSVSGFNETIFTFRGFFPRKSSEQKSELVLVSESGTSRIYLWFESPFRIGASLTLLSQLFPQVAVVVGKELTKVHEKLFHGSAEEVCLSVNLELQEVGPLGEWCFAVKFPKSQVREGRPRPGVDENTDWIKATRCLLAAGVTVSETAKRVSQEFGIARKISYETVLQISKKK